MSVVFNETYLNEDLLPRCTLFKNEPAANKHHKVPT